MRRFEIVNKRTSESEIKMPQRATKFSAGYDFFSPIEFTIEPNGVYLVFSDIKAQFEEDEVLILCTTSGMGKRGIVCGNNIGVIDADYYNNENNEGNIGFLLRNLGSTPYTFKVGEKIGQGIFMKYLTVDNEAEINSTRTGGFGSTDGKV